MSYPDFLCIGAQKAGTTWLYHQLNLHPEIWLPPVKELHYFDRHNTNRLIYKIFSTESQGEFIRSRTKLLLNSDCMNWARHFLFDKRTHENYQKLFLPSARQISGEITPAYARIGIEKIERIHSYMPKLKLIYLLRNPVERFWSQLNMYRRRSHVHAGISNEEIINVKYEMLFEHTNYTDHIKRWTNHFDSSQMFIGFFDQIEQNPAQLIKDIFGFLEVDSAFNSPELKKNLTTPQNQGHHGSIPAKLEYELTQKLLPEIEAVHHRFDNKYTQKWMERANEVLSKGMPSQEISA